MTIPSSDKKETGHSPGRLGWFRRRPKTWLVSGLVALTLAILALLQDALLSELLPKDVISDELRGAQGRPALQVVRVERFKLGDELLEFVRPDGYRFNPEEEQIVKNLEDQQRRGLGLVERAENGGVPVALATWRIFLRSDRNQGVRVLNIRPVQITRNPPLQGTLFDIPQQGREEIQMMGLDADSLQPVVRELEVATVNVFGRPYFENNTISLSDREDQIILFRAVTKRYDFSFSLEVDYQVGGQKISTVIDDNGRPFRVTAFNCQDGKTKYKFYYVLESGEANLYGAYPKNSDFSYPCI